MVKKQIKMKQDFPEKLFIKDKKNRIEYVIKIKESKKRPHVTTYSIFASRDSMWCKEIRGTLLFKLSDNGNGIKIKSSKKKKASFEYDEVLYLQILLSLNNLDCAAPSTITVVNEKGKNPVKII